MVTADMSPMIGLVVIGRNEGERLERCLRSVRSIANRVYVDSGSSDGSVEFARGEGVDVVELAIPPQFTAARARNAGLAELLKHHPELKYVQMVDGDCEVQPGWIERAASALEAEPDLALVFGRRRERYPDRSVYNALCDDEWNVPVGEAAGCGGDALFRIDALRQVDFYNAAMIAGEDSELSMRLRKRGWRLRRIDAEMTLHDAAILHFSQWWRRARRSGHGYAEMASLHPDARDPDWPRSVRSIVAWGGFMPAALLVCLLVALAGQTLGWVGAGLLALPWPLRMWQLFRRQKRRGLSSKVAAAWGILMMVGKVPQCLGLIGYYRDRWSGRASRLIEYKAPKGRADMNEEHE
jgi:cellulose synthase/poly-beta-1,6-N-acetylglucosamine synthase-like glycosyltransferase